MQIDKLQEAIRLAKKFIEKAKKVPIITFQNGHSDIETGKHSAACKRASLDLTRALTEMRKP